MGNVQAATPGRVSTLRRIDRDIATARARWRISHVRITFAFKI
jgi:hypothetical protein